MNKTIEVLTKILALVAIVSAVLFLVFDMNTIKLMLQSAIAFCLLDIVKEFNSRAKIGGGRLVKVVVEFIIIVLYSIILMKP